MYSYKRLKEKPNVEILNPFMYMTVFSAMYYLLGGVSADIVSDLLRIGMARESFYYAELLSIYTVLVYLFFYLISRRVIKYIKCDMKSSECFTMKIVILTISFLLFLFVLKNYSKIVDLISHTSRVSALNEYNSLTSGIPVGTLFFIQLTLISVVFCSHKCKAWWFLLTLPAIVVSFSSGSRTYLSVVFIAFIISNVYIYPEKIKMHLGFAIAALFLLLATTFIGSDNIYMQIYSATAEFAHTYLTIPYLFDRELIEHGQGFIYFTNPLVKFVGLSTPIEYFGEEIHNIMNTPISLAGNNITESLYYAGIFGAILYPIVCSLFFLLIINTANYYRYAFIFIFMLCIYMRTLVRGALYQSLTMLLMYLLIFVTIFLCVKIIPKK